MSSVLGSKSRGPLVKAHILWRVRCIPKAVAIAIAIPAVPSIESAGEVGQECEADQPEKDSKDFEAKDYPAVVQCRLTRQGDNVVSKDQESDR